MKRAGLGIAIVLGVGIIVAAQSSGPAVDEVLRAERAEGDATVKKDRAAYEQFIARDYYYLHSNGVATDRTADIADVTSADAHWTSFALTDTKVRMYGDAAILVGVETLAGSAKGYVPGPRYMTNVWIKQNGRWQTIGGQSTLVSKDSSSTAAQSAVKRLKAKTIAATTADSKAVLEADEAYARADGAGDDAKTKAAQTRDYSFVSRAGVLASPNDPPATPNKSMAVAYDRLRSFGTLAVVQGSLLWTDVKGFSPGVLRFTRVWVKDGGSWKLAAEQRTPIASPRPAS